MERYIIFRVLMHQTSKAGAAQNSGNEGSKPAAVSVKTDQVVLKMQFPSRFDILPRLIVVQTLLRQKFDIPDRFKAYVYIQLEHDKSFKVIPDEETWHSAVQNLILVSDCQVVDVLVSPKHHFKPEQHLDLRIDSFDFSKSQVLALDLLPIPEEPNPVSSTCTDDQPQVLSMVVPEIPSTADQGRSLEIAENSSQNIQQVSTNVIVNQNVEQVPTNAVWNPESKESDLNSESNELVSFQPLDQAAVVNEQTKLSNEVMETNHVENTNYTHVNGPQVMYASVEQHPICEPEQVSNLLIENTQIAEKCYEIAAQITENVVQEMRQEIESAPVAEENQAENEGCEQQIDQPQNLSLKDMELPHNEESMQDKNEINSQFSNLLQCSAENLGSQTADLTENLMESRKECESQYNDFKTNSAENENLTSPSQIAHNVVMATENVANSEMRTIETFAYVPASNGGAFETSTQTEETAQGPETQDHESKTDANWDTRIAEIIDNKFAAIVSNMDKQKSKILKSLISKSTDFQDSKFEQLIKQKFDAFVEDSCFDLELNLLKSFAEELTNLRDDEKRSTNDSFAIEKEIRGLNAGLNQLKASHMQLESVVQRVNSEMAQTLENFTGMLERKTNDWRQNVSGKFVKHFEIKCTKGREAETAKITLKRKMESNADTEETAKSEKEPKL
ncbi:uncharacterized protein LOC142346001 [Convolutriloba macropyga]|uniref:uncharacterized protein LOC142346001 n=1 Tax=Convolutriloba macropyga TaxID=536237 RepID=UPI003F526D47